MTDYISREEVLKAIQPRYAPAVNRALAAAINSVPAANVVKAIRCKDCEFSYGWIDDGKKTTGCCFLLKDYVYVSQEDFCSQGKRRSDKDG